MSFIQNLRIGTKLAITSLLTIALVALMIILQMDGGAEVQKLSNGASEQQAIAQNAAEAKASVRGMQIGIRDILTSASPAEMQKAVTYFNDRQTAALKFSGEMARLSRSPDNQKRIERLTTLIGNFQKGEQQIEAIRKQELALDTQKGANGDAAAQHAKLTAEVNRIRKETLAPINEEISELTNEITNAAKQRSGEARSAAVRASALLCLAKFVISSASSDISALIGASVSLRMRSISAVSFANCVAASPSFFASSASSCLRIASICCSPFWKLPINTVRRSIRLRFSGDCESLAISPENFRADVCRSLKKLAAFCISVGELDVRMSRMPICIPRTDDFASAAFSAIACCPDAPSPSFWTSAPPLIWRKIISATSARVSAEVTASLVPIRRF